MRVTRLNVAGEIAVALVVYAVLIYELVYSSMAQRALALAAFAAGVVLCRLTMTWLRRRPEQLGLVQLAIALLVGGSFAFADRLSRGVFLVLCAFVAGYLTTALAGLWSRLRAARDQPA